MPKPDPLIIQAAREAAESFNDLLQVIVLESHLLAQDHRLSPETAKRVASIASVACAAADLSRSLFGGGKGLQNLETSGLRREP